jgi:hypothetical protein
VAATCASALLTWNFALITPKKALLSRKSGLLSRRSGPDNLPEFARQGGPFSLGNSLSLPFSQVLGMQIRAVDWALHRTGSPPRNRRNPGFLRPDFSSCVGNTQTKWRRGCLLRDLPMSLSALTFPKPLLSGPHSTPHTLGAMNRRGIRFWGNSVFLTDTSGMWLSEKARKRPAESQ